jgi:hypothetical protein
MSRSDPILEIVTEGHPMSPDAHTVAVSADLLEEVVEHYIDSMTAEERLGELSQYIYGDFYDKCIANDPTGIVSEIVLEYVKDTI